MQKKQQDLPWILREGSYCKEPGMMYFPILNEELKNPRILKITG